MALIAVANAVGLGRPTVGHDRTTVKKGYYPSEQGNIWASYM